VEKPLGGEETLKIPPQGHLKDFTPNGGRPQKGPKTPFGKGPPQHQKVKNSKSPTPGTYTSTQFQRVPVTHWGIPFRLPTKRIGTNLNLKEIIENSIDGIVIDQFDKDTITTQSN